MEDGELGDAGDGAAGEILFGDYDELHGIVRGVDREFVGSGVHICRRGAGERDGEWDVAGDDYHPWGFLYGDDDSNVGGAVGIFTTESLRH